MKSPCTLNILEILLLVAILGLLIAALLPNKPHSDNGTAPEATTGAMPSH